MVCASVVFLSWSTNVSAIGGTGTPTHVSVFLDSNTITGFSDFVFVSSTKRLGLLTSSPLSTLSIAGNPFESSTSALVLLGGNLIVGGNASGTFIGANPTTFNGDFMNFQVASTSKFKVTGSGDLTASNLTITGLSNNGVMIASGTQASTVVPGTSGNVLTSNGSAWQSQALPSVAAASSTVASFTFGETVSGGKAVYVSDGTPATSKHFQVDSGGTLTNGLISYYKLDSDSSDYYDSNTGSDTAVSYASSGIVYYAASLNGSSSYVDLGSPSSLFPAAFTINAWVYINNLPGSGNMASLVWTSEVGNPGMRGMQLESNGHVWWGVYTTTGVGWGDGSSTLSTGQWYMLTIRYDSSNGLKCFVSGSVDKTAAANGPASMTAADIHLGSHPDLGRYFDGRIDEVGFWNRALTDTEIADLYNASSGQTMVTIGNGTAGLVYAAKATNHMFSDGFVGFAAATTNANNPGNVTIGGLAGNVSGVSAGKQYYLGTSSGTISLTPGIVTRKVGIGVATDTLLITNIW